MVKYQLLQGNRTNLPVNGFQNSTTGFRLTNQLSPAGVHLGRSPKPQKWAISEAPMLRNYKPLLPIAANSLFNHIQSSAFQQSLPPLSRFSSGYPKMATNESIKPENEDQLKHIFDQKRVLRSSVRKALKAMDPSFRSQEGIGCLRIFIDYQWNSWYDIFLRCFWIDECDFLFSIFHWALYLFLRQCNSEYCPGSSVV